MAAVGKVRQMDIDQLFIFVFHPPHSSKELALKGASGA